MVRVWFSFARAFVDPELFLVRVWFVFDSYFLEMVTDLEAGGRQSHARVVTPSPTSECVRVSLRP
jgi:hypothetical protein